MLMFWFFNFCFIKGFVWTSCVRFLYKIPDDFECFPKFFLNRFLLKSSIELHFNLNFESRFYFHKFTKTSIFTFASLFLSSTGKSKYVTADYAPSAMHMQFMQMNQHRLAQSNAAMMGSEMQAQQLQRAIEENNNKNSNLANLNRANLWETCSASYESFVKNLER